VSANDFRDHWAETRAEWSHRSAWLTSFVLPPTAVADAVSSAAGQMDLPFLVPVSATGVHITVQCVTPPSPSDGASRLDQHSLRVVLRFEREAPHRFRR